MKLTGSPLCTFCKKDETLDHLFWSCHIVSSFILDVEIYFLKRQFTFSKEDIFFGYCRFIKHPFNFLIFHLKHYIFQCKLRNEFPTINEFCYKLKFLLEVEKQISVRSKSKRFFHYDDLCKSFNL